MSMPLTKKMPQKVASSQYRDFAMGRITDYDDIFASLNVMLKKFDYEF